MLMTMPQFVDTKTIIVNLLKEDKKDCKNFWNVFMKNLGNNVNLAVIGFHSMLILEQLKEQYYTTRIFLGWILTVKIFIYEGINQLMNLQNSIR